MEVVERGLKRQEELLLQKLEKYEKSFREKIDKVVEAIQVLKENVAFFNNEDPLLENSSEEQDVFDKTSNKKDKGIEMEQDQDFVFDLSSAREEYEEEKDKDGDDRKLELTMGNAEAKPEILAAQTFGDVPENKKDKEATKNVVTVSKWQNFRSQDGEFSCCNPISLIEDEWEISRRERKKVQPSNGIMIFKEQAWKFWRRKRKKK
ncbi:hypothetical protein P3X46_017691 [Hevea brasiliensis]|uniref:Uncharacterized protein n=1 Tax=Hevea brasiliensis TaxID=3981 RepID=A0ABQ9LNE5_HEVBR|nr:hypothetical protein P3X46_017691 [Hevea brasiliensis]